MLRHAWIIALGMLAACKNTPPKGDLPPAPATAPSAAEAPAPAPAANPHASVPEKTAPKALEPLADGRLGLGPFTLVAPTGWTTKPVTSSMRAADFMLP